MVVCKFYIQGYCRYGHQCRYDHFSPQRNQPKQNNTGFSFVKTLNQISSNSNQNNANIFSNTNVSFQQPQSYFGQSSTGGKFSFNQTLQQINNVQNVRMPTNSLFTNEFEMKSDFPSTSSLNFPINNTFTFGNTAALNSAPLNIDTRIRQNDVHHWYKNNSSVSNQSTIPKTKSFFDQPMNQQPIEMTSESNFEKDSKNTIKMGKEKSRYGIYSELKDLVEMDLANFKADKFIYPIPFDPPPFEVCFQEYRIVQ
ncbi:uncharacterized protein LOC124499249 [Dermatophagoides farinae]|uniref:uncharacterized protein LOC124499249 n=1 Tax=Dermatophagoides farinae TaxID=6954 RepID=UPI003F617D6B